MKKAYISPETMVVNVKIEHLLGPDVSAGSEHITSSNDPDNPDTIEQRSRHRNVWDEEEEEDW